MTNIIRDVGKDLENGRIYLPEEDLRTIRLFGGCFTRRVYDDRFLGAHAL